jgi:hypothetical protein
VEARQTVIAARQFRREKRLHDAAAAVGAGQQTGPDERCAICRRRLSDHISVERGIGPVCWYLVLNEVGHHCRPAAATAPMQGELHL